MALEYQGTSVLGLNRHDVPLLQGTDRTKAQSGAYAILEDPAAQLTLVSTGSEVHLTVEAAQILIQSGIATRVVSMPSMRRFEEQAVEYINSVLPWDRRPIVSVEAHSTHGWARWSTASIGQQDFGTCVQAAAVYEHFGFTGPQIANRVKAYLDLLSYDDAHSVPWRPI